MWFLQIWKMKKRTETRLLVLKEFESNQRKIRKVLEYLNGLSVLNYKERSCNSLGFGGETAPPHLMIVFMDTKVSFDVFLDANAFLLGSSSYGPVRVSGFECEFVGALGEPNTNLIQLLAASVEVQMSQHYSMS
jgi:hypothetical protein